MKVLVALVALVATAAATLIKCEEARWRCAYRSGCGSALNNYMMMCEEVFSRSTSVCPRECGNALIALMSADEGQQLVNCECEDEYCRVTKQRMDICRPQVMRGSANVTSSCTLSQLICLADAPCANALQYYRRLCRSMFRGRKCSNKCINSIEILRKLEKAAGLTVCQCDGNEDYDCPNMQRNLARLCGHKLKNHNHPKTQEKGYGVKQIKALKENVEAEVPPTTANTSELSAVLVLVVFSLLFTT